MFEDRRDPGVVNVMEEVVRRMLEQTLAERTDVCRCRQCFQDMMALSLNSLPPHYVSTRKGETFFKVKAMENQFVADVVAAITHAMEQVKRNPRHGVE